MHRTQDEPTSPLRAARLRAGLSIEQLAVRAGIARQTLYIAEKAPHLMSDRTAHAVAAVLRLDPEVLRGGIQ